MKNKIIYIIISLFIIMTSIVGVKSFINKEDEQVKGHLEIYANDKEYDYLVKCANKFMELNDKTTVIVKKVEDYSEIENAAKNVTKAKTVNIGELTISDINKIGVDNLNIKENKNNILESYSKNFSSYRVEQVKIDDNTIGIPITSRPLALFVRDDMISKYEYDISDFNTWNDVIRIGKEIYEKSNGTIHILNATGQDYDDLVDLLLMQNLKSDISEDELEKIVNSKIEELKENNILNLTDGNEYLSRISSINAVREITQIEEVCKWVIGTAPSIQGGSNKFFAGEGENLIILNETPENKNLVNKFANYIITNTENTMEYVLEGKFFSSYLYAYKTVEIEKKFNNFEGTSPLVVLNNIEEKTSPIQDYELYLNVKNKLID